MEICIFCIPMWSAPHFIYLFSWFSFKRNDVYVNQLPSHIIHSFIHPSWDITTNPMHGKHVRCQTCMTYVSYACGVACIEWHPSLVFARRHEARGVANVSVDCFVNMSRPSLLVFERRIVGAGRPRWSWGGKANSSWILHKKKITERISSSFFFPFL